MIDYVSLNWPFWWSILAVVYAGGGRREGLLLKTYTICFTAWNLQRLMPWQKPLHSKSCPMYKEASLPGSMAHIKRYVNDLLPDGTVLRVSPRDTLMGKPSIMYIYGTWLNWWILVWVVAGNQLRSSWDPPCVRHPMWQIFTAFGFFRWASWLGQFDPHWRVKLRSWNFLLSWLSDNTIFWYEKSYYPDWPTHRFWPTHQLKQTKVMLWDRVLPESLIESCPRECLERQLFMTALSCNHSWKARGYFVPCGHGDTSPKTFGPELNLVCTWIWFKKSIEKRNTALSALSFTRSL